MLSNMAFCKLIFTGTVTWLFFLFISPSHAASSGSNIGYPEKVNLSLYYETLNPNCSNFIVQKLTTVFANDLISIINLRLVPWGNAFIDNSSKKIVCKVTITSSTRLLGFNLYFACFKAFSTGRIVATSV